MKIIRIFCVVLILLVATTAGVSAFSSTVDKGYIEESVDLLKDRIVEDGYYSKEGKYTISNAKIYSDSEEKGFFCVDDYGNLSFSYYYNVNGSVVESVTMDYDLPYSSYISPDVTIFYESPYYLGAISNFDASKYQWEDIVSFSQIEGTSFSKSFINEECSDVLSYALVFWNRMLLDKVDLCLASIGFTSLCEGHETYLINDEAAACTEDGYTGDQMCLICGEIVEYGKTIPALGHTGAEAVTKATAIKAGQKVTSCEVCGEVLNTVVIKPAKVTLSKYGTSFTGKKVKSPVVCVKTAAGKAVPAKYYIVKAPTNVKKMEDIGRYTYTVTFKNTCPEYKGTVKLHFEVKPVKTAIKAPTATKNTITVKWKAVPKAKKAQITGYEVQVATNKAFTKGVKKATVKGYAKVSKKITGLKAKTKYFVKVRTYKTVKGVKVYSDWSAVKSIKSK